MTDLSPRAVRALLVASLYLVSVLWGFHNALTWRSGALQLALTLVTGSAVAMACIADSRVVG
ncbi:MAG TPA: hypothetical protein VGZ22_31665 [Isosphaeraceae bacterium]|nr:hypothetical protein [Isosphaeraceae bacterium]